MSLYAIKNGMGEWYDWNDREFWPKDACAFVAIGNHEDAERMATEKGGHVVELVEAQAKIVVSEAEAKILTEAKTATYPSEYITRHSCLKQGSEDRLMRAYVNGWEVEKPKRYVLPMPGTDYHNIQMHGNAQYYAIKGTGNWRPDAIALGTDDAVKHGYTVTQSEIDAAPAWVKAIKPFEVTEDDE